ncbi:hypothetical protein AAGS61_09795 [Lysinibacillus sp. KU-BSD001]|uniref:hypothetical protein n=1 Tax=Lysinibacillus sp. KU-BSD001 TaxID=3141328 RepID=UPI0036EC2403
MIHNIVGIGLIVVSLLQAVNYWDESLPKSIFYLVFAGVIGWLMLFVTKKRKEIEREKG